MENTKEIRRSKPLYLFMYAMSLTCNVGAFYEEMVLSLTRCALSSLENDSWFSYTVKILGYVSVGMIKEDML